MIPASYTVETFSDYLEFEVLMQTAVEIGWIDLSQSLDPTTVIDVVGLGEIRVGDGQIMAIVQPNVSPLNSATHTIVASLFDIPAGTKISFGTTTRTTLNPVAAGATSITFTSAISLSSGLGNVGRFYNAPVLPRVHNPQYAAIINEVLVKLGVDDITSITGAENIKRLRHFGRRETWSAVMQALAGDFDYSVPEGRFGRYDVYMHAKECYLFENNRVLGLYGDLKPSVIRSDQLQLSGRAKAKARW